MCQELGCDQWAKVCGIQCSVVGDDDFDGSVAAENVFECKLSDACCVLGLEHFVLRPCGKRASRLGNVGKSAGRWHLHGVHVYNLEETSRFWDGWWNVLRSFVNFVTQGYKGTVGSSREFWHLMTKEV